MDTSNKTAPTDAPVRIRDVGIRERVGDISIRTAGELLRAAVAAGVLRKLNGKKKGITIGRWSDFDDWLANGCEMPARKRGRR